jgi:hypothetical protein
MTDKQPILFTFHKIREEGELGNADAWQAFLNLYSPMSLHLLNVYVPGDAILDDAAKGAIWAKTLDALSQNNFEKFRATERQSEREFLVDVRVLLFDMALAELKSRPSATAAEDAAAQPNLDLERLGKIVEGLPLMHQEVLWLKLAGYTDATIERILRTTPRVAQGALVRLEPDFAAARELSSDGGLWPRQWLALLPEARAAKKDDCPALHQLLRIHDGQVSWYDKEPVEKRVACCLHCLERWTALHEVSYWRRVAPAIPPAQIDEWLRGLPVTVKEEKKSLLKRVFSR